MLGWRSIVVTPEMVGQRLAVFAAIEVKKPGEKPTGDQKDFLRMVESAGGIAGVAHSPEEAAAILEDR